MKRRKKLITVVSLSVLGLGGLVIVLAVVSHENALARIQREINRQGYSMISEREGIDVHAQTARMEDNCLILEGSSESGKEPYVLVNRFPHLGSMGICSASSVSIELVPCGARWVQRLKMTFPPAVSMPGLVVGRTQYVYVPKYGKPFYCFLTWWFGIQDRLHSRAQKSPDIPPEPNR
jgi:hypothetical protein